MASRLSKLSKGRSIKDHLDVAFEADLSMSAVGAAKLDVRAGERIPYDREVNSRCHTRSFHLLIVTCPISLVLPYRVGVGAGVAVAVRGS